MSDIDGGPSHRLVAPSGGVVVATVEQMVGTGGIARIEVTPDGAWDVEYNGCTDVIWDTETSFNEGPDRPQPGPHGDCSVPRQHRHPDPAYDQFMTADGSIVLRKDIRLERLEEETGRWVGTGRRE